MLTLSAHEWDAVPNAGTVDTHESVETHETVETHESCACTHTQGFGLWGFVSRLPPPWRLTERAAHLFVAAVERSGTTDSSALLDDEEYDGSGEEEAEMASPVAAAAQHATSALPESAPLAASPRTAAQQPLDTPPLLQQR
jgi:hypothetical protein